MRIEDKIENLTESLKEYVNYKIVSVKLSLVEKLSLLARDILSTLIIFFLTTTALIFALIATLILIAQHIGFLYGSLAICATLAGIALIVCLFRKRLFTNIFVARFSKIFFNDDASNEKDELFKYKQH